MSRFPRNSPWGAVQRCEQMIKGVYLVDATNHGGIMVRKNAADFLSDYARKIALKDGNYLCFEEDRDEMIVVRELLDKKLWSVPDNFIDKIDGEERMNLWIKKCHPEYWAGRSADVGLPVHIPEKSGQKRSSLTMRLKDKTDKSAAHSLNPRRTAANCTSAKRTNKQEAR